MRTLQSIRTAAGFSTLFAALFGFASGASALSITLDNCDNQGCQGVTLFLDVTGSSAAYNVTLTINADSYTGTRLGLNQVGFKAISNWTSATLDSSPTGAWAAPVEAVNSSNNLCLQGTSTDKVCTHGFVDITGGGDFTWAFTVVGGTLLDPLDWHIGGQFANGPGIAQGELISAAIPEPTAALVFALGFGIVIAAVRRRA
jgi:hypothetical protein